MSEPPVDGEDHREPVIVATFIDIGEAEIAMAKLRAFGIESAVLNQAEGGTIPTVELPLGHRRRGQGRRRGRRLPHPVGHLNAHLAASRGPGAGSRRRVSAPGGYGPGVTRQPRSRRLWLGVGVGVLAVALGAWLLVGRRRLDRVAALQVGGGGDRRGRGRRGARGGGSRARPFGPGVRDDRARRSS